MDAFCENVEVLNFVYKVTTGLLMSSDVFIKWRETIRGELFDKLKELYRHLPESTE